MSYIKAEEVLPQNIIQIIQQYIDGENIYIPKKENARVRWGEKTGARQELERRNSSIYRDFLNGEKVSALAGRYFLSDKTIQRIIRDMRVNESV